MAPQMSFGTGHHATTHLMSARMLELSMTEMNVLDMGCGTGVLALVAARLGAAQILGIDIELNAVLNARDNVALNPSLKKELLTFELGDGSACDALDANGWHVVCANIQKNVLSADMAEYAESWRRADRCCSVAFLKAMSRTCESSLRTRDCNA